MSIESDDIGGLNQLADMDCYAVQAGKNTILIVQQERKFRASQDDGFNAVIFPHFVNDSVDFFQRTLLDDAQFQFLQDPFRDKLPVCRIRDRNIDSVLNEIAFHIILFHGKDRAEQADLPVPPAKCFPADGFGDAEQRYAGFRFDLI